MTAEEMFKSLGYEKVDFPYSDFIYYERYWFGEHYGGTPACRRITINKKNKTVELFESDFNADYTDFVLNKELLKAINKQIEELGWNV